MEGCFSSESTGLMDAAMGSMACSMRPHFKIQVNVSFREEAERNALEDKMMSPEERLDLVEQLRLEAGKLIYWELS